LITGRCSGMEMKNKVVEISRQPSPVHSMVDQIELENVEYFKYLSNMTKVTQDVEMKLNSRLPWQKLHSTGRIIFTSKLDLNLRKKITLYGELALEKPMDLS
jgi:hypothetical protein